jgi:hypothetical protein
MTGCKMAHIPYKGAGPALNDLIAGQVQVMFDNLPSSAGFIKDGRIRALAVTTATREASLPNVPTVGLTLLKVNCKLELFPDTITSPAMLLKELAVVNPLVVASAIAALATYKFGTCVVLIIENGGVPLAIVL